VACVKHFFHRVLDDWLADGYRFRQNGSSLMLRKNPLLKKTHYRIYLPGGVFGDLKKYVYASFNASDEFYKVVRYVGKEEEAVDFPHG